MPGSLAVPQLIAENAIYLKAISCGAVFMGANTYIGNAPNFMVRSIAEEAGTPMPSFFGYMFKYSIPILCTTCALITLIFSFNKGGNAVNIKKLLFATKFEVMNLEALKSLLDLKQAGLEEILLTYIIPRDMVAFVAYGGYLKEEADRLRAEAGIRFEDWCDDLVKAGVGVKVVIEVGDPVPEIMKLAEAEQVDLIVCGGTRRTEIEKIFAGSRTLDLLRRTKRIPVLVSKHMVVCHTEGECLKRLNEHPFRRPLFAADWSQPSEHALQFIAALRGLVRKVDLAHVEEIKISKDQEASEWQRIEAESREHLHHFCETLGEVGIPCEPHLAAGDKVSEVLRLSGELNSTMIILGTTAKDRLHKFFQGSLSQEVAETSDLPTLLIP